MKAYGSAVFTALQARHKDIDNIAYEARHRCLDGSRSGYVTNRWWEAFWKAVAFIKEAQRAKNKGE